MTMLRIAALIAALGVLSSAAIAAAPHTMGEGMPASIPAPNGVLPAAVHHAGSRTVAAYQAALDAPEVLAAVPCTCGCEALGHRNNLDCYIEQVHADGTVFYSTHGLYCQVCQQITSDAVAGAEAGMPPVQLHDMIVAKYGGQH